MKIYKCFYLQILQILVISTVDNVPFGNNFRQPPHIQTFQTTSIIQNPTNNYIISYPSGQQYTTQPIVYTALYNIQWKGQLSFMYYVIPSLSYLDINIESNTSSTLNQIIFNHIIYDQDIYSSIAEKFTYYQDPATWDYNNDQIISITHHQKYHVTILSCLEYKISQSGFSSTAALPKANVLDISPKFFTQYQIQVTKRKGLMISRLEITMVKISIRGIIDPSVYIYVTSFGSNANITQSGDIQWRSDSNPSAFYGINMIHNISSISSNIILESRGSSSGYIQTNAKLHAFIFMFTMKACYSDYPYYHQQQSGGLCKTQCPSTTYLQTPASKECLDCTWPCTGCVAIAQNCTGCEDPFIYTLFNEGLNTHICNCPVGQWGIPGSCTLCSTSIPGCIQCQNGTICKKCDANLNLTHNNTQCQCLIGTLFVNSAGKHRCVTGRISQNCHSNLQVDNYNCRCPLGSTYVNGVCT